MLTRIVKLEIQANAVEEFLQLFKNSKATILASEGCFKVELLSDLNNKCLFFTYSLWENEEALNNYRKSEFFGKIWPKTKSILATKPSAWSLNKCDD